MDNFATYIYRRLSSTAFLETCALRALYIYFKKVYLRYIKGISETSISKEIKANDRESL